MLEAEAAMALLTRRPQDLSPAALSGAAGRKHLGKHKSLQCPNRLAEGSLSKPPSKTLNPQPTSVLNSMKVPGFH